MINWTKYTDRDQLPDDGSPFLALIDGNKKYRVLPVVLCIVDYIPYQYIFDELIGDKLEHVILDDILFFYLINDEKGEVLK